VGFHDREAFYPFFGGKTLRDHGNTARQENVLAHVFMIMKDSIPQRIKSFAIMESDTGGTGGMYGWGWRGKGG
jgi:hypothetical protein